MVTKQDKMQKADVLENLKIKVPEGIEVIYLGEVKDANCARRLANAYIKKKYNYNNMFSSENIKRDDTTTGYCLSFSAKNPKRLPIRFSFIAYREGLSPTQKVFTGGHEETHVLYFHESIGLLEKKVNNNGINVSFNSYSDEEARATFGGIYALALSGDSGGVSAQGVTINNLKKPELREALRIRYALLPTE